MKENEMISLSGVQNEMWAWSEASAVKVKDYSSDTSGGPLQLVGPAVAALLPFLQVLPLGCHSLHVHAVVRVRHSLLLWLCLHLLHQVSFLPLVLPFPLPNLVTEVVHTVQSRVINQRQEVSVPKLLIRRFS